MLIHSTVAKILSFPRGILENNVSRRKKKSSRDSFRNLDGCELLTFSEFNDNVLTTFFHFSKGGS